MPDRVALVGCGAWGKNLARNLASLDVLKTIVDPSEAAGQLAEQLGVSHRHQLSDVTGDPDVFAIVLATPAATHHDLGVACLSAGKHLYVEKPITLSVPEARALSKLAEETGLTLMVGHILQYHPVFRSLKALVQKGELGEILHITSNRMSLGRLRFEEDVLWSFAPHDISMVLSLAPSRVKRVRAIGAAFITPGLSDIVSVHIEFECGMLAEIRTSWINPHKEQTLTVTGKNAMAFFDDGQPWESKLTVQFYDISRDGEKPQINARDRKLFPMEQSEPLRLEMEHFLDCASKGLKPDTNASEAIAVLEVLSAASESLKRNMEWVNV